MCNQSKVINGLLIKVALILIGMALIFAGPTRIEEFLKRKKGPSGYPLITVLSGLGGWYISSLA